MENKPLIVGAGPTGLAAALFLASRGVAARIIDSAPAPEKQSRALVVNPRTLELLEFERRRRLHHLAGTFDPPHTILRRLGSDRGTGPQRSPPAL